MPEGKFGVVIPRTARCAMYKCKFHGKESRYAVKHFYDDDLIVFTCLECVPPTEIARFKLAKEEAPDGNQHRILKPRAKQFIQIG